MGDTGDVSCPTAGDPLVGRRQVETARLRQLATDVGRRLSVSVMLEPLWDLPPSLPASRIRNEIEQRVRGFPVTHMIELDIRGTHQGIS